jgi:transcriptional regulator with XRE-family HTH domain
VTTKAHVTESTLRARLLGRELRVFRSDRGLTLRHVAAHVGVDMSGLARAERGDAVLRPDVVAMLLEFYGLCDSPERDQVVVLARVAWRTGWDWELPHLVDVPSFIDVLWLESLAERTLVFATSVVPVPLQTSGYANALMAHPQGDRADPGQLDRWVELTERRQAAMTAAGSVVRVVMEESVLCRPVRDPGVYLDQLRHLATVTAPESGVEVRVLPTGVGPHPGWDGPFRVFHLPSPFPPVVHVDGLDGRRFLDNPTVVEAYVTVFDRLTDLSENPTRSTKLIISATVRVDA